MGITRMRDIGWCAIFKLVERRSESSKPLSQIIEIPDVSLNEKLIPTNDNYQLTCKSMESFEAGSILTHDFTKPSKREQIGLILTVAFCVVALTVFVFGLAI